ncbi:MAG: phosphatidylglycerol lysyltransferase domain-containing protein [Dehalococcoidia bacterium]|nr:phosphatidylglycerol lysyltransferase domain-containing protein [Dehalococcoidia bacterium]
MSRRVAAVVVALAALSNGVVAVALPVIVRFGARPNLLGTVLPFGLHHWGRLLTPLFGLLLIYLAYHLWRRRRVAWWATLVAAGMAALAHLTKGDAIPLALGPLLLAAMLLYARPVFTVHSDPWTVAQGLLLAAGIFVVAFAYGVAGFYYLDRRDFGITFSTGDAVRRSVRQFALLGNTDLHPRTRHARWFLDSLDVVTLASGALVALSIGLPLRNRYRVRPRDREDVRALLERHGGTSLDYFKLWPGKTYFFTHERDAAIAYGVNSGCAVSLGDPVGESSQLEAAIEQFVALCRDNAWSPAFHQVPPRLLSTYRRCGLRVLKIGEEASVPLDAFASDTARNKSFRTIQRRFEREGSTCTREEPPLSPGLIHELRTVSDSWLSLPGRRERGFTLGRWDEQRLRDDVVYVVRSREGEALAFANLVPSYRAGEATIDLMRHRAQVMNGTMDFLFLAIMTDLQARGFEWFSLGMAPFAGIGEEPDASLEERAIHELFERLNRFFSYRGLRAYKSKFEPQWEGRYLAYAGGPLGLGRTTLALTRLTEAGD